MNAAIFTKSAKGLILASGLIAASSIMGYAQDAPVALGAQATVPLSGMYILPPSGITTLGGHTFDLTAGNAIQLVNGQSVSLSGSCANATGWSGTAIDGSAGVIDMLTIGLAGTKTVTGISMNDTNTWGALAIVFSGLTVSMTDPTPAPAPDPTCTRPGNSCNTPAAENSQADKWQPTTSPTTPSITTPSDKHTNSGHHTH